MNNSLWRSEDGQLLRSLREEAGIDELVFARNNTLSLAQLRELEQGGNSSFYNAAIKRNTGVKLLKKLGHEWVCPNPVTLPASPLITAPPKPARSSTTDSVQVISGSPTKPPVSNRRNISQHPVFWSLSLLSLAVLVVFKPWALKDHAPLQLSTSATENTTPALVETSNSPVTSVVTASATPKDDLPATVDTDSSKMTTACDWQHRVNSKTHTPSEPIKPGNYIYLEAQADTELCVIDSQNQKTMLQLKAGTSKSVYGSAPFLIHSQDWQNLKLFFQGRRVHEALTDVQHLLLKSQPL